MYNCVLFNSYNNLFLTLHLHNISWSGEHLCYPLLNLCISELLPAGDTSVSDVVDSFFFTLSYGPAHLRLADTEASLLHALDDQISQAMVNLIVKLFSFLEECSNINLDKCDMNDVIENNLKRLPD